MSNENPSTVHTTPNFSLAFKQMASFVAIAKTRATSHVLDELILQCFVVLPSEPLSTSDQVAQAMLVLFGIQTNPKDVSMALARLTKAGTLCDVGNGHLSLSQAKKDALNARLDAAKALEKDVRETWLKQVHANAQLIEERAALAAQLESEKAGREAKQRELEIAAEQIRIREQSLEQKDEILRGKEQAIQGLQAEKASQTELAEQAAQRAVKEHEEKEAAKRQVTELEQTAARAEQRAIRTTKIASIIVGLLAVGLFELIIRSVCPWTWLLNHPNGYGLEGCISLMIFFAILGLGVRQWRKTLWVVGFFGVAFVALQIVGGHKLPSP